MHAASWRQLERRYARTAFFLQVGITLAAFVAINAVVQKIGSLPEARYLHNEVLSGIVFQAGPLIIAAAVVAIVWLQYTGQLLKGWDSFDRGGELRWFVSALALVMAWPLATLAHNFYFDRSFLPERALLVVLALAVVIRPAFVLPFIVLAYALLWQLAVLQLGGSILAHKLQVLHVLEMFAAAWIVNAILGSSRSDVFVFLGACLVAAAYWTAFVAKMQIGWMSEGSLHHALIAAWSHGWLSFLPGEKIVSLSQALAKLDLELRLAVLFLEGGCLFLLLRRWVSLALMSAVVVFHLAVFSLLGFLFWTWIAVDLALIGLLVRFRANGTCDLFSRVRFALSVVLIATSIWWAQAPFLGWFDTRVNYVYRVEATLADGRRVEIAPSYFAPYEDVFTMASFSYLSSSHGILVGPYGVTQRKDVAGALRSPIDVGELAEIEERLGRRAFDQQRADGLRGFLDTFVKRRSAADCSVAWWDAIAPPPQFWSFRGERDLRGGNVSSLLVREVTYLYDDVSVRAVRDVDLLKIDSL